ncbi:hypothetical protein SNOG_03147 [Parastagonospora nodorum SN15]|uniref:Uncharacterized protein n=1 Tax=Phaeosphaeria nodorum (strain SN15 / ATCC MYA-4574 / FGSC 10173) TaxID=321614 RepID=Q0UYL7_PHANO|nr:hypothetical protein SNOG_03147 [Parastagonospora nodorum SN15]EAT89878.1 hypothetical protein SNOG_03147 [Parastagonospora nodorum SN15]
MCAPWCGIARRVCQRPMARLRTTRRACALDRDRHQLPTFEPTAPGPTKGSESFVVQELLVITSFLP